MQQGNLQRRDGSRLCRKAAPSQQHLQDSVALSLFQEDRKETYGRPAEAGCGAVMQFFEDEELAQLESDSFLHALINAVSFFPPQR